MRHGMLVVIVGAIVFLTQLGATKLWDRDEPRNAGCAREMLAQGDWVVPVFNQQLRTHKPILLYWMMMTSYAVLGVSEWSARLGSALCAIGTCSLTFTIGCRLFRRSVGCWAGCILATFVMFGVIGRAATPDSVLIFFTTLAMALFVRFSPSFDDHPPATPLSRPSNWPFPASRWQASGIYAAMAAAVLAKGPVGMVLPTAVIGMYCLILRDNFPQPPSTSRLAPLLRTIRWFRPRHFLSTCWAMRPGTAVAIAVVIALPWYAWVGWRTDGEWLRSFFGEHNLGRAMHPREGHDGSPWLYYPLALLVCCFPWTVFSLPTVFHWNRERKSSSVKTRRTFIFLTCWIVIYVGAFSAARTKLPSYVAPTYPAIALMIAAYVASAQPTPARKNHRALDGWTLGTATAILAGFAMAGGIYAATRTPFPSEWGLPLIGLVPIVSAAIAWWYWNRNGQVAKLAFAGGALCFALGLHVYAAGRVSAHQHYAQLFDGVTAPNQTLSNQALSPPTITIGCYDRIEPTWVYYSRKPIRFFETQQLSAACEFLEQDPQNRLIISQSKLDELKRSLGIPPIVDASCPYFLRSDTLFIVKANPALQVAGGNEPRRAGEPGASQN